MQMYTQCPHCQTIFRINAAHLNIAQGQVRCSRCRRIFNATQHLIQKLPQTITSSTEGLDQDFSESDIPELLKEDMYASRSRSWGSLFFWFLISILLVGLFLGQYMWLTQRDEILQNPQLRPWLQRFCYNFLCTLPETRDLANFHIENRDVRTHPTIADAIQVEITFSNRAVFSQPYPDLQLTFEDTNGVAIAGRRFKPEEYLSKEFLDKEMKSGASVHIKLELVDMAKVIQGNNLVKGFRFDFL
ncbi:MAG: hypothetical protein BWK79_12945 [Beggiatoa sp. IS2]|nr:MAG: hypothetical protein BWK79_12945 [Beggiatoa sp. IS2]